MNYIERPDIKYLCDAYVFYGVRRYDIRGKKYLNNSVKYYLSDALTAAEEKLKTVVRHPIRNGSSGLYKRKLYGYAKDDAGNLMIDEDQAETVRKIFQWYMEGYSVLGIISNLAKEKIPSPTGKERCSKPGREKEKKQYRY